MKVTKILVSELDRPNPNGRIYTATGTQQAIDNIKDTIDGRKLLGEIGVASNSHVNLEQVSHIIDRLWIENDNLYADATLLETPTGLAAQQLFSQVPQHVRFGIRGFGMVNESFTVSELTIIAIDVIMS
jgi:Prohead core protein serine protease